MWAVNSSLPLCGDWLLLWEQGVSVARSIGDALTASFQDGFNDCCAGMDTERVGITGASGGGLASTRAILQFPEFFKVAVSFCGK